MTLPKPKQTVACSNCGRTDEWCLAKDMTEYTDYAIEDGTWVAQSSSLQPSSLDDAVRFICSACGTCHEIPEGLE